MNTHTFSSQKGFTLIELMISMTIFAMMSIIVMSVYFQVTGTSRKLNAERTIANTAREVTERIANDIDQYGFSGSASDFDNSYALWDSDSDYIGSGSEILNLANARYVYGAKQEWGMKPCTESVKTNSKQHCGLYLVSYADNGANGYNLIDSFNPDESKKRVKVEDLKFYVSGDGVTTGQKVMLNMTLSLMERVGVSVDLAHDSKLHIQTTFALRSWKK